MEHKGPDGKLQSTIDHKRSGNKEVYYSQVLKCHALRVLHREDKIGCRQSYRTWGSCLHQGLQVESITVSQVRAKMVKANLKCGVLVSHTGVLSKGHTNYRQREKGRLLITRVLGAVISET